MTGVEYRQLLEQLDVWWPAVSAWPPETEDAVWERLQPYPLDLAMKAVEDLKHLEFRPKPGVFIGHCQQLQQARPDVWPLETKQLPGPCPKYGEHVWGELPREGIRICAGCHTEEAMKEKYQ